MKKPKEIRKRIKVVANTKKITKTMEMVATSKFLRAQERVKASTPYANALSAMLAKLTQDDELKLKYDFLQPREPKKVIVFLITANRGLCGGFNSNLIDFTRKTLENYKSQGIETELRIAGKKGVSYFTFQKFAIAKEILTLSDRPTYEEAKNIAEPLIQAYLDKETDRVDIIYAEFQSMLKQPPTTLQLLPIENFEQETEKKAETADTVEALENSSRFANYKFSPDPEQILEKLLPLYLNSMMYRVLIESVASEQSARRVAMKNATDNSEEIIKTLTRQLNKARQAQITSELSEIVSTGLAID